MAEVPTSRRSRLFLLSAFVALFLLALAARSWWHTDLAQILHANNRGVGLMELYDYEQAIPAFEEVVRLAPNWRPGRINLGIALLNTQTQPNLQRARALFEQLLQEDPDNPYAHFCLGILLQYLEKTSIQDIAAHFAAVTRVDPQDAAAWFRLGSALNHLSPPESQRATECFQKAVQLDPYLSGALYNLGQQYLRSGDPEKGKELLDQDQALKQAEWYDFSGDKYSEVGRYATVMDGVPAVSRKVPTGPLPRFVRDDHLQVQLRPGARWSKTDDLDRLRQALRAR
jgi:tetratricopeptide (TPR) repeat protein